MELQIKIKMMCFWNKLVGNPDKFLSGKIYRLLFKLFIRCNREIPWMDYTTSIFDEIGLAIYGMVKNTLTLICWRILLNKDYKINIFKNGFQISKIRQEGNIIQNSKLSSNRRFIFSVECCS